MDHIYYAGGGGGVQSQGFSSGIYGGKRWRLWFRYSYIHQVLCLYTVRSGDENRGSGGGGAGNTVGGG